MRNEAHERPGRRALAILALVCGVAMLPSVLAADFLNFDDPRLFGPFSELADGGLLRALDPTRTIVDAYLPVSHLSLWLDRAVFGDRPLGPHLHSFVLHVLVAFCVARLGFRLGLPGRAAIAAAAVFAVHPALCESALWVRGRGDLLAGLFVVLTLSTIVRHARGELGDRAALWRTTAFAVLAVYAKGTAIVLPLLGIAVVWLVSARGRRGASARPLAATFVVAALAGVHHLLVAAGTGAMAPVGGIGERLAQVPGAFGHYLSTAVWPVGLNVIYPEVATLEVFRAALLPGLAVLGVYAAAVVWLAFRQPKIAAGLVLFAVALLPFNTALPASSIAAADRYLYLAIPGLAFALAAVPRVGVWLATAAVVPLVILCHGRAADFESSEALWKASLAVDPDNALALVNLAPVELDPNPLAVPFVGRVTVAIDALQRAEGRLERAFEVARYPQHRLRAAMLLADLARGSQRFERAARYAAFAAAAADELDPAQPGALVARVETHLQAARLARTDGDLDAAQWHFAVAAGIAPDHPYVLCFSASLLQAEAMDASGQVAPGDPRIAEAEALLGRAAILAPGLYELHWARGEWARATGRLLAAEKNFRRATELEPTRRDAWRARVDLFLGQPGMAGTAEEIARQGLGRVDDPGLRFRLALALSAAGRIAEARQHYEAYLALRPHDAQARAGLASVLSALGMRQLYQLQPDALDRLADRILELRSTEPKALLMKAVAARGRYDLIAALVLLESVRERMPDDPEVEQLYAETLRDRGWQLKLHEDRPDAAFDRFRQFLDVAPPSVPTDAVANAVRQEWRRQLEAGKEALVAGDAAGAETRFRRCNVLLPEDSRAIDYYLGLTLYSAGGDRLEQALACFERAEVLQRERSADPGLAVLYQVQALQRLGREGDATSRGRALLDAGAGVAPDVLERVRAAIDR